MERRPLQMLFAPSILLLSFPRVGAEAPFQFKPLLTGKGIPVKKTRTIAILLLCLGAPVLPASEPAKTIELVGETLDAWRADTGAWRVVGGVELGRKDTKFLDAKEGIGVIYNGPERTCDLLSKFEHGDVRVHVEFVVPKGSNSGVYLQGRYEVQILDSWGVEKPTHGDCGGIYQRWKDGRGFEGHAPKTNASLRPGEWQTFDILFRAPRFDENGDKKENARFLRVIHNGRLIHEDVEVTGPTRAARFEDEQPLGPLMLQGDHGPVAYRNITITPLDLSKIAD